VITVDLVTMPKAMVDMVATRVRHRHGIDRSRLLINFPHTHSGPMLGWPAGADRKHDVATNRSETGAPALCGATWLGITNCDDRRSVDLFGLSGLTWAWPPAAS
jgi:hypothetical protein